MKMEITLRTNNRRINKVSFFIIEKKKNEEMNDGLLILDRKVEEVYTRT